MKYSPEDIKIGDEVTFLSTNSQQSDFDEFWTVHGKDGDRLLIHLNHIGQKHYWEISISEIITKLPKPNIGQDKNL